jgi:alpha,alpha-trehalose phosphorylase
MLKREIVLPPEHFCPPDEWRLRETRYSDEFAERTETIFSLGNGFIGIRGSFEEGRPALRPGTFVNGFHETWPIVHAEEAPALARKGQTIVNVPDATILKLYVDDEPLFLPTARVHDYARVLDMRAGTLTREFVWATAAGKHVRVRSCRLVSLEHRHVVAMTYEVTVLDDPAPVTISSMVLNRQDARSSDDLPEYRPGRMQRNSRSYQPWRRGGRGEKSPSCANASTPFDGGSKPCDRIGQVAGGSGDVRPGGDV